MILSCDIILLERGVFMATIEIFNFYYFLYIFIALILTLLSVRLLKYKSDKFRFWFIFGLIMANFAIHFLKILIYPYTDTYFVEHKIVKISLENICAVSVVTFPLLYFSKSKILKDYMVLVGLVSGMLTLFYPVDTFSTTFNAVSVEGVYVKTAFQLETIRFYLTHFLLFLTPFLILHYKIHQLSVKRAGYMPFVFMGTLLIIYINELILSGFGLVPQGISMYNPDGRNPSLIFGVKNLDTLVGIGKYIKVLVPDFLTVNPVTGETFYWPVLWMFFPVLVNTSLMAIFINYIYDKETTKDFVLEKLHFKKVKDESRV